MRRKREIYEPISWWIVFGFAWGTRQVNQLMNIGFWLDSFIGENRTISSLTVEGKNKSTKRPPFSFWMLCLLLKVRAGIFIYFLSSLKVVWRSYYLTVVPYPVYIVQFFKFILPNFIITQNDSRDNHAFKNCTFWEITYIFFLILIFS